MMIMTDGWTGGLMALNQNKYYPCQPVKLRRPHNLSLPVSRFLSPSFALCESHAFLMNFALAFSTIRPSKIRTGIIGWLLDKCQPPSMGQGPQCDLAEL